METKTSKAQIEVWEMKETVYNNIKVLPKDKRIAEIMKNAEETINQILVYKRKNIKSRIN